MFFYKIFDTKGSSGITFYSGTQGEINTIYASFYIFILLRTQQLSYPLDVMGHAPIFI